MAGYIVSYIDTVDTKHSEECEKAMSNQVYDLSTKVNAISHKDSFIEP